MTKKIVALGLVAVCAFNLSAAGKKKMTKDEKAEMKQLEKLYKNEPEFKDPKTGKLYDFGGMEVLIGDWWSPTAGAETKPVANKADEDTRKWHKYLQYKYNFVCKQVGLGNWNQHPQTIANFCVVGGDENYVFVVDNRSATTGFKSDLYLDLNKVTDVNWNDKKYNKAVWDLMTKNGKTFGCRPLAPEPRTGFFFNKRLLSEANIDPESIYDMQKAGTWTWENFEKVLKKVTRDIDNDGIIDVWGMGNNVSEFCNLMLASNGGSIIERDAKGKYYNNLESAASIEAITWIQKMYKSYQKPTPEGANWDWCYAAFKNGETAFLCEQEYYAQNFGDMLDDYGFVVAPKGPRIKDYHCDAIDNIYVIPSIYGVEKGSKIAKIFDIYMSPTPGYDDDDAWKEEFYSYFRDNRAVDETLAIMRTNAKPRLLNFIPGLENPMYDFWGSVYEGWETPQEATERVRNPWQALIDEANK